MTSCFLLTAPRYADQENKKGPGIAGARLIVNAYSVPAYPRGPEPGFGATCARYAARSFFADVDTRSNIFDSVAMCTLPLFFLAILSVMWANRS